MTTVASVRFGWRTQLDPVETLPGAAGGRISGNFDPSGRSARKTDREVPMSSMTSIKCRAGEEQAIQNRAHGGSRRRGLDSYRVTRHDGRVVSNSVPHNPARNQPGAADGGTR